MMQATPANLPPPFTQPGYSVEQKPSMVAPSNVQDLQTMAPPGPMSIVRGDYEYHLVVGQQPVRARMCGFGDKDRRPITPPPCVRLKIINIHTKKEVPLDEIDATFFLLQVDLWDLTGRHEKNIVRASSNSPAQSISSATTTSYPPPPERPMYASPQQSMPAYQGSYHPQMIQAPPHAQQYPQYQSQPLPPMYGSAPPPPPPGFYTQAHYPGYPPILPPTAGPQYAQGYAAAPAAYAPPQQNAGMFTRNLIGSLTVNAFTLRDDKGDHGLWFVLQDLSVRTEGWFRLKMNFIDVGMARDQGSSNSPNALNKRKAPVLASVLSDAFQVFSAKKFPGVIESTPISKVFAGQGIKIPIRKEGSKQDKDDGLDDD